MCSSHVRKLPWPRELIWYSDIGTHGPGRLPVSSLLLMLKLLVLPAAARFYAHLDDASLVVLAAGDAVPPAGTSPVGCGFLTIESPSDNCKLCYKLHQPATPSSTRSAAAASVFLITTSASVDSPLLLDVGINTGASSTAAPSALMFNDHNIWPPGIPPGWRELLRLYLLGLLAELAVFVSLRRTAISPTTAGWRVLAPFFIRCCALYPPPATWGRGWAGECRRGVEAYGLVYFLYSTVEPPRGNCDVLLLVYYFGFHFSSHTSFHYQVPCCFTHLVVCQSPRACGRAMELCTSTSVSTYASPVSCSIYCE